jgi:hypothetical protein
VALQRSEKAEERCLVCDKRAYRRQSGPASIGMKAFLSLRLGKRCKSLSLDWNDIPSAIFSIPNC